MKKNTKRIDGKLLSISKFGQRRLVVKNWPGDWSQSGKSKTFE